MEAEKDSGRRLVCSFFFFSPNLYLIYDRFIYLFILVVSLLPFLSFSVFCKRTGKKNNKLHAKGSKQLTPPVSCEAQGLRHLCGEEVAPKGVEGAERAPGFARDLGGCGARCWAAEGGGRGMRGVVGETP